jgi:hypothetical protein
MSKTKKMEMVEGEAPLGPENWHQAVNLSLWIYAEGAKGNCSVKGTREAHAEIMRCADIADTVPALVEVLQAFRWIMETYTGDGAQGSASETVEDMTAEGDFDPEQAIAAIDKAMASLPRNPEEESEGPIVSRTTQEEVDHWK